jgi:hypothetical protein
VAARSSSGSFVDRHPTIMVLPLLVGVALWMYGDTRRLATAMSLLGWPMVAATVIGAAFGALSVTAVARWIASTRRAGTAGHDIRSSASGRWARRAVAVWLCGCFAAAVATHPRFNTAEQWRLTTGLGAATVAYLLVLALALATVLVGIFIVLPVLIRKENADRRQAATGEER